MDRPDDELDEAAPGEEVAPEDMDAEAAEERKQHDEDAYAAKLDQFGTALVDSRTEAINARAQSGIEEIWLEDEEFYEGIDDLNRGEFAAWRTKPPGGENPKENESNTVSTVFPNITRPYVDAASARVADMLLPTDDRAYSIKTTPVAELTDMAMGKLPRAVIDALGAQYQGQPDQAANAAEQMVRQAIAIKNEADNRAEKAQKRIEDWHVECQYHAENRQIIEDAARIGTAVLKGPIPAKKRVLVYNNAEGRLIVNEEIKPVSKRISAWNMFPSADCGENIHNGSCIWEMDDLSQKQLEALKGTPGYIDFQIDRCIKEGPTSTWRDAGKRLQPDGRPFADTKTLFKIWYYHGNLTRDQLELCGCALDEDDARMSIPAQVTMVNDRVIKAILNPLDTGEFPYDVMVWQKKAGTWTGIGVARQIRTPQRIVVGAARNMMDNAGRAGGPQLVIQQGVVVPHDGVYEVTPWKVWLAGADKDLEHIDNAFRFVTIPTLQAELMAIIQFGLKLAEDVTGLPMLLQGQQGKAPDTLGGMQMLNNNASTVLRRLARLYDDMITEPHIRRYYAYLLQYGEDDEKGDFQIDARGSSALVERDLQNQAVLQMGPIVKDPAFGINPKKWFDEYCKSQRLDARRFQYTEEEQAKIDAAAQQGPTDPRIAVARMRVEHEERMAKFEAQTNNELMRLEQSFDAKEAERDRELELALAQLDNMAKGAELTAEQRNVLAGIKQKLTDTVIKVNAQERMSRRDAVVKQTTKPPTEPAGRAPAGQAYQH